MKTGLFCAGILGFTGVTLGAFGAHALKESLQEQGSTAIWQTAVLYHLIHASVALSATFATAILPPENRPWLFRAVTTWFIGTCLFSGSLYVLALGGPKWLGPVTPLGGAFLLTGWICVLAGACKSKPNHSS